MMEIEIENSKFQQELYLNKSANQKNYMDSLQSCLESKQAQMIEIVRTEDKIDSTLKTLLNFKLQKPKTYKQIIICCSRERDTNQYFHRITQLANTYPEIEKQLRILKVSNKKKLCIEESRLEKYDEEIFCKYKRKVDQDKCKYHNNFKILKNNQSIGVEKGLYDEERLVREGKANSFCSYFTQTEIMQKADIIICEHKNIFKEEDKQKDIYQFIGMKKSDENGTFLFIDQSQYLYEDIQSYNTFNIEQQMVHQAVNKCRQLKGIIFDEAKLISKDKVQNILKKDYEKLIYNLERSLASQAQSNSNQSEQQQNSSLKSFLPMFVKNPITLVEYLQNACLEINTLFEKHFVTKKSELEKHKWIKNSQNPVPPMLVNEKMLRTKELADLKNLYPMTVQLRLVLDELLSFMFQQIYHPSYQKDDSIQSLYIISDFLYFFTQNYQNPEQGSFPLKIFFQDHPEYLKDAICYPILTITPGHIKNLSKRIFGSCSNYILTSDCIVQRNEQQTTTILGLSELKQRITLRFELEPQVKYNIMPMFITKWNDQSTFESTSSHQKVEDSPQQLRNYVNIINRVCEFTPDGIVIYLPNIAVFMKFISDKRSDILSKRPVYFESPFSPEKTIEAFTFYKHQCDAGQGAFFFCVANGWASRNIDFNDHYARALLILGYPIRKEFYQFIQEGGSTIYGLDKNEFYSLDTITRVTQCIKSVYSHTNDYCTIILADLKLRSDSDYLPKWANQNLKGQDELTVDDLFQNILEYQKAMGRLYSQNAIGRLYN